MVPKGYSLFPRYPSFQADYLVAQVAVQGKASVVRCSKARCKTQAGERASGQFRAWAWHHSGALACHSLGYPGLSWSDHMNVGWVL